MVAFVKMFGMSGLRGLGEGKATLYRAIQITLGAIIVAHISDKTYSIFRSVSWKVLLIAVLNFSVGSVYFAFTYAFLAKAQSAAEALINASMGWSMDAVLYFSPVAAGTSARREKMKEPKKAILQLHSSMLFSLPALPDLR